MADCVNNDGTPSQKLSAAFPNSIQTANGLQINPVTNSVFDMNSLLSAAKNYVNLNNVVNQLIGMEVRWFRSIPQQRSQDVIFQEYTLSSVMDTPLCLKAVLPSGNFPDSKYNYDLMGLEYEIPLEIHIDKKYWESIAGFGTAPQKNDIVYFAVPNKLYEVVSSYLFRGFMEQETTWKINLRKYQPKASRKEGDLLKDTIDKYTVSAEEIFGEKTESDIRKLVDDKQMSAFNSTTKDKYKTLDPDLNIILSNLNLYGILISESFYDLNSSRYFDAITYNGSDEIYANNDRCITAWTMIDPGVLDEYNVVSITYDETAPYPANYLLTLSGRNPVFEIGDNFEISRPGSLNLYAKYIQHGVDVNTYYVKIDDAIVTHLASIKSNWATSANYKMKVKNPVSILHGYNSIEDNGFKIDIYSNQYIKIKYATQEHIAIIPSRLLDKMWYGIVVNIGNTWNQYNVYVYKQHESDYTNKLQNIFYETLPFTAEPTIVEYYKINKSPSYITNIRLYVSTLEEEKQKSELLSYFTHDGDQLIIGDNSPVLLKAPYIGQQR